MMWGASGITLYVVFRKFFILWKDVISVKSATNDPRLSRGKPPKILKIEYTTEKGTRVTVKHNATANIGIPEFLAYYQNNIEKLQ